MPTFDGINLLIILDAGVTTVDIQNDLYEAWKDWLLESPINRGYPMAFRTTGGDPLTSIINAGAYFFLQNQNGWRIKPAEEDATILMVGNLAPENPSLPMLVPTDGDFSVMFAGLQPVTQGVTPAMAAQLEYASFGGGVTVDPINGYPGIGYQGFNPIGSQLAPSNNIADAVVIANSRGFTTLYIKNDVTLSTGDNVNFFTLVGDSHVNTLVTIETEASCVDTIIKACKLTGVLDGGTTVEGCLVGDITYVNGHLHDCGLFGNILLAGGEDAVIENCHTVEQADAPIIDMGGSGQNLALPSYAGLITIKNCTGSANRVGVGLIAGAVTLESTVTAGIIVVAGVGVLNDNSTGTPIINTDGLMSKATVANAVFDQTREIGYRVESLRDSHASQGHVWYWAPYDGNDGNTGETPEQAVQTFEQALTLAHSGDGDVIYALATDPSGTTTTTERIIIDKDTVSVRGPGPNFVFNCPTGTGTAMVNITANYVAFEGFSLIGQNTYTVGEAGIMIMGVSDYLIRNIKTSSINYHGIHIENSSGGKIENVDIKAKGNGIHFVDSTYCFLSGFNIIHYCGLGIGQHGIHIDGTTHGTHIHSGTGIHSCGGYGIKTESTTQETFVHPDTRIFSCGSGNYSSEGSEDSIAITLGTEPIAGLIYRVESLKPKSPATGKIVYLDPIGGNDSNDGRRPDRAKATFAGAQAIVTDGGHDVIQLLDIGSVGEIIMDEQWVISKNDVTVRGPGWDFHVKPTATTGPTILITGEEVVLEKFQVSVADTGTDQACIRVENDQAQLYRMKVKRAKTNAIELFNSDSCCVDECLIEHNTGGTGILVDGDSHEIRICKNFIYDNIECVKFTGTSHDNTVTGNTLHDSSYGIYIDTNSSHNYIYNDNIITNNSIEDVHNIGSDNFLQWEEQGNVIANHVWDEPIADHLNVGSTGSKLNTASSGGVDYGALADAVWSDTNATTLMSNVQFVKDVEGGRWRIDTDTNEMIFYKDDNITEIMRFDLKDASGSPTSEGPYERVRQ